MEIEQGKGNVLFKSFASMIAFSISLRLDSILQMVDSMVGWGWSLLPILAASVLIRMVLGAVVVLFILPAILGFKGWRTWLPGAIRIDAKIVLLGIFSFGVFSSLATCLALGLRIFNGNFSTILAFPDIRPDPDVIGWGYFLLALVPAIWEELAFRGLIQAKLEQTFSTLAAILLSSAFFGLYHFSNLVSQPPEQVVTGVIMAFFFGIGWAAMTVKARSVVPAMISHYLVDSIGQVFLNVSSSDPAVTTGFFLLLTVIFPLGNMILAKRMYAARGNVQPRGQLERRF